MSYLRGPLTREQIRALMDKAERPAPAPAPLPQAAAETAATSPEPPAAEPGIWQLVADGKGQILHPSLGLRIRATFGSRRPALETPSEVLVSVPFGPDGKPSWKHASVAGAAHQAHPPVAHGGSVFASVNPVALQAAQHQNWQMEARTQLGESLEVPVMREGKITGAPFETESEFRLRLEQAAREERDEAVQALRKKYETKLRVAADKVNRAGEVVARQKSQARAAQMQTAISVGTSVLGALFGKKASGLGHITRAGTAARGATRAMKESSDVGTAEEKLAAAEAAAAELEAELEANIDAIPTPSAVVSSPETVRLKLLPATLRIESAGILWTA
jgi:hypothetical protein